MLEQSSGGFALAGGNTVLAPSLLGVLAQSVNEPGLGQDVALVFGDTIEHQESVVVEDPHQSALDLDGNLLADVGMGNHVAVGPKADQAVLVDFARHLLRGVVGSLGNATETRLLKSKALTHLLPGGAVDPLEGHRAEPVSHVPVCSLGRGESVAPPEPLSDVIDRTLHLALVPGGVGRCGQGLEAIVPGRSPGRWR